MLENLHMRAIPPDPDRDAAPPRPALEAYRGKSFRGVRPQFFLALTPHVK